MNGFERKPAVSGLFYPDSSEDLSKTINSLFLDPKFGPGEVPPSNQRRRIFGIVAPHAGYFYSGAIAANAFYEISSSNFDTVIIIGPNHYGIGSDVAIMKEGSWITPLGRSDIDANLASEVLNHCEIVEFDSLAHSRDHCIEVQLPFVQFINKSAAILPIILKKQDKNTSAGLGQCLGKVIKNRNVMLIASSDLTHYEPNQRAHTKDAELISSILSMNISEFYSVLESSRVSACGYGAIAAVMFAAKAIGSTSGKLLRYATSGDVAGDLASVVGYSSILFV
ncbi:MAG TPA: AmmeMemoRadiSam system protein B [Nitrososphaeraceae archaeon]